jgi:hypothetical protein
MKNFRTILIVIVESIAISLIPTIFLSLIWLYSFAGFSLRELMSSPFSIVLDTLFIIGAIAYFCQQYNKLTLEKESD